MRRVIGLPLLAPLAVLAAIAVLAGLASPVLGHGPAHATDDPRCADWTAGNAPAGLDLTAVCIAHQVVGAYAAPGTDRDPLLPYVGAALVAGMGLALVGVLALRFGTRPVARRLESRVPASWWVCEACHSVNADDRDACYACRRPAPAPAAAARMPTAPGPAADTSTPGR